LNRRIGGASFDAGGAQAVRASAAMHETSWMLLFFTRREQRLTTQRSDRGVRCGACTAAGKAAVEAGAVTHGAVRCSAWRRGVEHNH
jgi:hypothetical protein